MHLTYIIKNDIFNMSCNFADILKDDDERLVSISMYTREENPWL